MSISAMSLVWKYSEHKGGDLLTMLAIADFSDDTGRAYPAIKTLAKKTRMTDRGVQKTLKHLQAKKELFVQDGAGPHGVNLYQINLKLLERRASTDRGEQSSGVNKVRGEQSSPKVNPSSPGGVNPSSPNPSLEPSCIKDNTDSSNQYFGAPENASAPTPPVSSFSPSPKSPKNPEWTPALLWVRDYLTSQTILTEIQPPVDPHWWQSVDGACSGIEESFLAAEFAKMEAWLIENPSRRPTVKGTKRFMRTWLERGKEHYRRHPANAMQHTNGILEYPPGWSTFPEPEKKRWFIRVQLSREGVHTPDEATIQQRWKLAEERGEM